MREQNSQNRPCSLADRKKEDIFIFSRLALSPQCAASPTHVQECDCYVQRLARLKPRCSRKADRQMVMESLPDFLRQMHISQTVSKRCTCRGINNTENCGFNRSKVSEKEAALVISSPSQLNGCPTSVTSHCCKISTQPRMEMTQKYTFASVWVSRASFLSKCCHLLFTLSKFNHIVTHSQR